MPLRTAMDGVADRGWRRRYTAWTSGFSIARWMAMAAAVVDPTSHAASTAVNSVAGTDI